MIKQFLQGTWLGHPLHPIMAHLPTALFPAAVVFDLLSRAGPEGNPAMVQTSNWCILAGLIAVLAAVPTGLADWLEIKREKPAWKLGLIHGGLNVVVSVIFLINLILRWREPAEAARVGNAPLILSIVGAAILLVSGWIGGRMIYNHGISVARHSKHELRKIAIAAGANVPPDKGGD